MTAKLQKTHQAIHFDDLPPEIIHHVFSFIDIKECEAILPTIPESSDLYDIVKTNIYGRTILYLNSSELSMMSRNKLSNNLFKFVNKPDLKSLSQKSCYIPNRFVLSYSYSRSRYAADELDPYLIDFNEIFKQGQDYFSRCEKFELSIDLFNKKSDSNEVEILDSILSSHCLSDNLAYLDLNRFQRLSSRLTKQLSNSLTQNLCKFSSLHTLTLSSNNIQSLNDLTFPPNVLYLNLLNNKFTDLPTNREFLPPNLIKLNLSCNNIKSLVDVRFPPCLEYLDVQLNSITKLSKIDLPSDLKVLVACGNNIIFDDQEIMSFPKSLVYLNLLQNPFLNNLEALKIPDSLNTIFIDSIFEGHSPNEKITYV